MFNIDLFRQCLELQVKDKKLSLRTMKYYLFCLENINGRCKSSDFKAEDLEMAISDLCRQNNQISKYLAAVKKYEREMLGAPKLLLYGECLSRLYGNCSIKPGKELVLPEATYIKKINRLNNERLKLALRLQHSSGLRISEIAALQESDIFFKEEHVLSLIVRNGKGKKSRTVNVEGDTYLYDRLKAHIENIQKGEMIFYSRSYLIKKTREHDMQTHDLRRINARQRLRREESAGSSIRKAKREVADQLGHKDIKTTNIYLGRTIRGE